MVVVVVGWGVGGGEGAYFHRFLPVGFAAPMLGFAENRTTFVFFFSQCATHLLQVPYAYLSHEAIKPVYGDSDQ